MAPPIRGPRPKSSGSGPALFSAGCTDGSCTGSLVDALSPMPVRDRDPGLYRRLGADVAPTDRVVVDVPGGEAAHAVATDRPYALAITADVPDPWGVLRQLDARVVRWLHHGVLDSLVLKGHGPPRVESSEWKNRRRQGLGRRGDFEATPQHAR